jgi:hypothetical protein
MSDSGPTKFFPRLAWQIGQFLAGVKLALKQRFA